MKWQEASRSNSREMDGASKKEHESAVYLIVSVVSSSPTQEMKMVETGEGVSASQRIMLAKCTVAFHVLCFLILLQPALDVCLWGCVLD